VRNEYFWQSQNYRAQYALGPKARKQKSPGQAAEATFAFDSEALWRTRQDSNL